MQPPRLIYGNVPRDFVGRGRPNASTISPNGNGFYLDTQIYP